MRKTAEELAKDISNFVNGARPAEVKRLAELMSNDHPTLQQSTMGLCLEFITAMANKNYTDARNEDSKEHAQAALNGIHKLWVQKFTASGMNPTDAEKQATAVISNLRLPLI